MTEMFGEAWSPMSVPDLAPDDDDDIKMVTAVNLVNFFLLSSSYFLIISFVDPCLDLNDLTTRYKQSCTPQFG